jgi:NAD(P)-dependent dehydrogenase (short-subunit alcohol dehydrogenase family)
MNRAASVYGKVVVITGGARGIGLATATALHLLGAKVAIGDVDEPAVKEAGTQLGLDVCGRLDVTDHESFGRFLDEVEGRLGPIDVLVNNAGILPVGRLIDEPDALTRRALAVNVYGVILGTKVAARRMLARRSGHIINVASVNSETPSPGVATYCATKHAVLGFTNSVRAEHRGTGVHYSAVLPAMTNTEMIARHRPSQRPEECRTSRCRKCDRRSDTHAETTCHGHPGSRVRADDPTNSAQWRRGRLEALNRVGPSVYRPHRRWQTRNVRAEGARHWRATLMSRLPIF